MLFSSGKGDYRDFVIKIGVLRRYESKRVAMFKMIRIIM